MRSYLIVAALALAVAPANSALAGGKGGGGHAPASQYPKESVGFNYGQIEWSYKSQNRASQVQTDPKPSKAMHRITNVRANHGGTTTTLRPTPITTSAKSVREIKGDSTDKRHEPEPPCPLCTAPNKGVR